MKRILSFSTGNMWRWTRRRNLDVLLKYLTNQDISGVELTFAFKERLFAFKPSPQNKRFLQSLPYVSIHAPFHLVEDAKGKKEIIRQLDRIGKIYDSVNAKNVILHPVALPGPDLLARYDFFVSTENMIPRTNVTISDLGRLMNCYPGLHLCLDVSHAYLWSKYETARIIKQFRNKISQVHFSGTYRRRDHQSLSQCTKDFYSSIKPAISLQVPFVIEEDIRVKNPKRVCVEIGHAKKLLGF